MIFFLSSILSAIKFVIQTFPYTYKSMSYSESLEFDEIHGFIIEINSNNNLQYAKYLKRAEIEQAGVLIKILDKLVDGTLFMNGEYKTNIILGTKPPVILAGIFDKLSFFCKENC